MIGDHDDIRKLLQKTAELETRVKTLERLREGDQRRMIVLEKSALTASITDLLGALASATSESELREYLYALTDAVQAGRRVPTWNEVFPPQRVDT